MINASCIIDLVNELKKFYTSPLKQLVFDAYDLYRLWWCISENSLYDKLINLLDIPSPVLNENVQVRRNVLKYLISYLSTHPIDSLLETNKDAHISQFVTRSSVEYTIIDNTVIAIRALLSKLERNKKQEDVQYNYQIVVPDYKIRNLIAYAMGIKNYTEYSVNDNDCNSSIVKLLNTISFDSENTILVDIFHIRFDCDYTYFFDVSPYTAWTNDIGRLWLSGKEREILGLTDRINWQKLLNVSSNIHIFTREPDIPQWLRIHDGNVKKIDTTYPQICTYKEDVPLPKCCNLKLNTTEVANLLHNPYLLYVKSLLQLNPKCIYTDDMGKIYTEFNNILRASSIESSINKLKEIDYFYYKKIQSFIKKMPEWHYPLKSTAINDITITYSDNYYAQVSDINKIDYYTLSNSISAKDVITGTKTGLMIQALSIDSDVHFNIISPNWHSGSSINKKTIEISKDVIREYKARIISAWDGFKKSGVLELKFDLDKTSMPYKHLERVQ